MQRVAIFCLIALPLGSCGGPAQPGGHAVVSPDSPIGPAAISPDDTVEPALAGSAYQVEELLLTEQPALVIRGQSAPTELETELSGAIPRLIGHAVASGLELAGPPFVRYYERSEQRIDFAAGIPVVKPGPGSDDIESTALPAGPAIATLHVGHYRELPLAHEALRQWAERAGRRASGAPWEVFLTNPIVQPDSSGWRTKVFLPLAE
ncbi:MAG: GyrI-like domain-containing protein [Proteobacteria bacterium]|nr:GyrI-like domain-containing protein [Pseudomonadota bacterium]